MSRRERRSKLIILIENDHKMNMETILSLFNLVDTQNAFSVSLIIWNVEASESFVKIRCKFVNKYIKRSSSVFSRRDCEYI